MYHLAKAGDLKQRNYSLTKKVMLFCNARDEKHLREWIAHHLILGFDKIVIFDHKSKIPVKDWVGNFPPKNVSVIRTDIEAAVKLPLMNQAAHIAQKEKADWMIYLDADEYLILHYTTSNIRQFLNRYNHAHSVGVNWLMYGSNNLVTDPNDLILTSYTKSEILLDRHVKSFCRPSEITGCDNPHFYHIKNKKNYFGINNVRLTRNPYFNNIKLPFYKAPCYIAHFYNQSEETFRNRRCNLPTDDRGIMRELKSTDISYIHGEYNKIDNIYAAKRYGDKIKKILAKFQYDF
jgi:hypothetical protein